MGHCTEVLDFTALLEVLKIVSQTRKEKKLQCSQ